MEHRQNYWLKDTFVDDLDALTSIDNRNKFIGLRNENPICLLDVNGDIKGDNFDIQTIQSVDIDTQTFSASNVTINEADINQINADYLYSSVIDGSNITSSNIYALRELEGREINFTSNLYFNGASLYLR